MEYSSAGGRPRDDGADAGSVARGSRINATGVFPGASGGKVVRALQGGAWLQSVAKQASLNRYRL
ncbi:MAG: hypothetical protein CMP30_06230 [Roseibacillus sp.]|nr:hypothetical protein [Roseibacillus sp.]